MAGNTKEAHQALLLRLNKGLQSSTRSHGNFPLIRLDEHMHLPQVDMIRSQQIEGTMEMLLCFLVGPLFGFGGQEKVVAVALYPGAEQLLGGAIAVGSVDMVDAILKQQLHRTVGFGLGNAAERGRAKDCTRTLMPGATKRPFLNHGALLTCDNVNMPQPNAATLRPLYRIAASKCKKTGGQRMTEQCACVSHG